MTYDVVVAVDNPEQMLMPGMTAYVNIVVAQHAKRAAGAQRRLALQARGETRRSRDERQAGGKQAQGSAGTVYVYVLHGGCCEPFAVRLGITDDRVTEVLAGASHDGDARDRRRPWSLPAEQASGTLRMRMF